MNGNEAENLRLENLRLWTQMNRLEQEIVRLRQGLVARGVRPTDHGSNSVTAALLTIDMFREVAEDLAGEFEKLRQGMADRGLDLHTGNAPGTVVEVMLAWLDTARGATQKLPTLS